MKHISLFYTFCLLAFAYPIAAMDQPSRFKPQKNILEQLFEEQESYCCLICGKSFLVDTEEKIQLSCGQYHHAHKSCLERRLNYKIDNLSQIPSCPKCQVLLSAHDYNKVNVKSLSIVDFFKNNVQINKDLQPLLSKFKDRLNQFSEMPDELKSLLGLIDALFIRKTPPSDQELESLNTTIEQIKESFVEQFTGAGIDITNPDNEVLQAFRSVEDDTKLYIIDFLNSPIGKELIQFVLGSETDVRVAYATFQNILTLSVFDENLLDKVLAVKTKNRAQFIDFIKDTYATNLAITKKCSSHANNLIQKLQTPKMMHDSLKHVSKKIIAKINNIIPEDPKTLVSYMQTFEQISAIVLGMAAQSEQYPAEAQETINYIRSRIIQILPLMEKWAYPPIWAKPFIKNPIAKIKRQLAELPESRMLETFSQQVHENVTEGTPLALENIAIDSELTTLSADDFFDNRKAELVVKVSTYCLSIIFFATIWYTVTSLGL